MLYLKLGLIFYFLFHLFFFPEVLGPSLKLSAMGVTLALCEILCELCETLGALRNQLFGDAKLVTVFELETLYLDHQCFTT